MFTNVHKGSSHAKACTQFFSFAFAPTCRSGGTMSNDTMSGAYSDITPSRSMARSASTHLFIRCLMLASSVARCIVIDSSLRRSSIPLELVDHFLQCPSAHFDPAVSNGETGEGFG